jgi:hypothetical protein
MIQAVRRSWESLSLYLPVLLMALLALGSWWLVRNAPSAPKAAQERSVGHDPDYTMVHFMVKDFDVQGRMQSEIRGTRQTITQIPIPWKSRMWICAAMPGRCQDHGHGQERHQQFGCLGSPAVGQCGGGSAASAAQVRHAV